MSTDAEALYETWYERRLPEPVNQCKSATLKRLLMQCVAASRPFHIPAQIPSRMRRVPGSRDVDYVVPWGLAVQDTILTLSAETTWPPLSILKVTFLSWKVQTSSQNR